ncbi:auxilin-like clathrin-binding protein required for normal clathrin function [Coemansia sp. RSA 552]|nr:auxilin-like clathrin-binding protein required for normal clathrin function [Coemansia sp. RSA 552]
MDDLLGLGWPGSNGPKKQQPNYSPNTAAHLNPAGQSRPESSLSKSAAKDDPFGELVSFTSTSSQQRQQENMSLHERQQQRLEEQAKVSSQASSPFSFQQQGSLAGSVFSGAKDAWDFDALERSGSAGTTATTTTTTTSKPAAPAVGNVMDFDPLGFTEPPPTAPATAGDLLGDFAPPPQPQPPQKPPRTGTASKGISSKDVFGDDFASSSSSSSDEGPLQANADPPTGNSDTFADRDFEIAQVANYGFTTDQAKAALEITGSARAAIRLLREQKATARHMSANPEMTQKRPAGARQRTPYRDDPSLADDVSSDDEGGGFHYGNSRGRGAASSSSGAVRPADGPGGADALLASANELGTNVWKQANSWFAMGKKKFMEIQETVSEQRWPNKGGSSWNEADYLPTERRYPGDDSSSSDDYDDYVPPSRRQYQDRPAGPPMQARPPMQAGPPMQARPPMQAEAEPRYAQDMLQSSSIADPIIDMGGKFDSGPPTSSPALSQQARPPKPSRAGASQSPGIRGISAARQTPPAAIPVVPEHILAASNSAKANANQKFKLGQFGEAIEGYSAALTQVVQHSAGEHPLLILLYNNRALAYSRNGEPRSAHSDCTLALQLCDRYQANGSIDLAGGGQVNVADQRAKSLQRRGEAYEASEHYEGALTDWKALREAARDASMRQQAGRGIQRCERALGINQSVGKKAPLAAAATQEASADIADVFAAISLSKIKEGGSNILTQHTENSPAVAKMRRSEQAKQQEDDERLRIVDQVEAQLRQWKDGKQSNLRALLSTVHTVLPSFKPVGMHEVIQPNKVKRVYMRTIARLHPDKLSKDVDLRTKMVSSSVFTALNEAWDAFKAQEGVS